MQKNNNNNNFQKNLKNNFISIIIPVYNAEAYIETSLKSISNQTFKNFEFIIIEVSDLGSDFDKSVNKILEDKGFMWIKDSIHHISSVNGKSFCDKLYKKIN